MLLLLLLLLMLTSQLAELNRQTQCQSRASLVASTGLAACIDTGEETPTVRPRSARTPPCVVQSDTRGVWSDRLHWQMRCGGYGEDSKRVGAVSCARPPCGADAEWVGSGGGRPVGQSANCAFERSPARALVHLLGAWSLSDRLLQHVIKCQLSGFALPPTR